MKKRILLLGLAFTLLAVSALAVYFARRSRPPRLAAVYLHSPLGDAILHRDAPAVDALIEEGANPNARYRRDSHWGTYTELHSLSGLTPLMVAALGGLTTVYWDSRYGGLEAYNDHWDHPQIVNSLLAYGADPNAADDNGWTPLLCATRADNVNIARSLLAGGADVNKPLGNGGTVLITAAYDNNLPLAKLFLLKGAHVNAQGDGGLTALSAACDAMVRVKTVHGQDFHLGSLVMAQFLLEHGAAVNPPGGAPLAAAVDSLSIPLVSLLLKKGADVNAADNSGMTPLMRVPRTGQPSGRATGSVILSLLLARGADVHARSLDDNTALTWAADKGDLKVVRSLLRHGADVNAVNRAGHSSLWFAVNNGDAAMRNLLLSQGANSANTQSAALPAWRAGIGNYNVYRLR